MDEFLAKSRWPFIVVLGCNLVWLKRRKMAKTCPRFFKNRSFKCLQSRPLINVPVFSAQFTHISSSRDFLRLELFALVIGKIRTWLLWITEQHWSMVVYKIARRCDDKRWSGCILKYAHFLFGASILSPLIVAGKFGAQWHENMTWTHCTQITHTTN